MRSIRLGETSLRHTPPHSIIVNQLHHEGVLSTWGGGPRSSGVGFFLFCVPQSVKTKETNPTRPGSLTPCKQALKHT